MLQEEREDEEEIVKKRIADHNRVFKDYSSFVTFGILRITEKIKKKNSQKFKIQ